MWGTDEKAMGELEANKAAVMRGGEAPKKALETVGKHSERFKAGLGAEGGGGNKRYPTKRCVGRLLGGPVTKNRKTL